MRSKWLVQSPPCSSTAWGRVPRMQAWWREPSAHWQCPAPDSDAGQLCAWALWPMSLDIKPTSPATWNQQRQTKAIGCYQSESAFKPFASFLFSLQADTQACQPRKWHQENSNRFLEDPRDILFHIFESDNMLHSIPKSIFQMM